MNKQRAWTGLIALSLATTFGATVASAQPARGGPGAGAGMSAAPRGGGGPALGGGMRMSPGPGGGGGRAAIVQQGGPRIGAPGAGMAGARIEPRIRSGAVDIRREGFQRGPVTGAAPLTISRDRRVVTDGRYTYGGRYYDHGRRRYYDRGWRPGLLAAPFLFPWYLGGGYGYDYDYDYGPAYYDPYVYDDDYPAYSVGTAYPTSYGGALGGHCATPQKTCQLYSPAEVGLGCSCRAPAGLPRFRGTVVP